MDITPEEADAIELMAGIARDEAAKAVDGHEAADPVANSLLAQFAKLQKDSARRRTRGQ